MYEENSDIIQFKFDDEALYPGVEIVEPLALDSRTGEKRVGLLTDNWQHLIK